MYDVKIRITRSRGKGKSDSPKQMKKSERRRYPRVDFIRKAHYQLSESSEFDRHRNETRLRKFFSDPVVVRRHQSSSLRDSLFKPTNVAVEHQNCRPGRFGHRQEQVSRDGGTVKGVIGQQNPFQAAGKFGL